MQPAKPTLTVELVDYLREQISSGKIPAGEKLPSENALIEQRGVSRTVIREAITRLQAEGLIHTKRGAGSFALTPPPEPSAPGYRSARTVAERTQLLEFRTGLEAEAAALAATRHDASHLLQMDAAIEEFTELASNPASAMTSDYAFHLTVAQASGNGYFADALAMLGPSMIAMPRVRLEQSTTSGTQRLIQARSEHQNIRDAIASGNPQLAAAAMRVHIMNSGQRLRY